MAPVDAAAEDARGLPPAAEADNAGADAAASTAAAASAARPGYSAPIVKVELEDAEKAAASEDLAKAEAQEEAADYGGAEDAPAEAREPQRAMPDYGDLIDDDPDGPPLRGEVKSEANRDVKDGGAAKAEMRPTAIHINGVQRLTRSHLAEIFTAKGLPCFARLEWLSDEQVLCIFSSAEEATSVLAGVRTGFGDAQTVNDTPPGPGLWRAQRCMLDFREGTTADVPDPTNRRLHRAGRQVREYRFWEAMKEQTRGILAAEDARGTKRLRPSGEDAIAAAEWDDYGMPLGKRRRVGQAVVSDEEAIDILELMAKQDKDILTKEEDGASQANSISLVNLKWPDAQEESWAGGRWWDATAAWHQREEATWWRNRGSWQHDDRYWQGGGLWGGQRDDARKRRRGGAGARDGLSRGAAEVLGESQNAAPDEEEQAKRARRGDRFKANSGGAAGPAPMAAKEEVLAR